MPIFRKAKANVDNFFETAKLSAVKDVNGQRFTPFIGQMTLKSRNQTCCHHR